MFENLSERLERSFKLLKGQGKITEINVAETLKDVRRALLDADVNYSVAKQFTDTVKAKALGQNVITAVKPSELMVKIVHDELALLMGGVAVDVNLSGNPTVILMSGLQGSGKTTFSGKLARKFKSEKGKRPLLVACDVYRPAAIEQLKVLGEQIDVPVYTEPESKNPVEIAQNAIKHAKAHNYDMVIVDTAGRLAVDEQMMDEIEAIKKAINPQETLFVVDAMTGQDAVNTAKEFNQRLDSTVWYLRSLTVTPVVVRLCQSARLSTSLSSLSVRARNSRLSTCSIRHVWLTVSSAWATLFHLLSAHSSNMTRKRRAACRRRLRKTSLTSTISWRRLPKSRRWVT